MQIEGKRAVITGGASGIGLAIAHRLVGAGCAVVIADIDTEALQRCSTEHADFLLYECDVTKRESLEALADFAWSTLGGVDLVFANAGVGLPLKPLLDQTEAHARWVMEVNYFGVWHTLQVFGPRLIEQGTECHLVVTGSENSVAVPAPLLGAYNASKHAVLGLTETFDRETPDFLGVSILCPGLVMTNILSSLEKIPDAFGGPEPAPIGKSNLGFTPDQIAINALAGIDAEDFYIFTHHCNRDMVAERLSNQIGAIERQTQPNDGSDICNTRHLLGDVFEQMGQKYQ